MMYAIQYYLEYLFRVCMVVDNIPHEVDVLYLVMQLADDIGLQATMNNDHE